MSLPVRVRVRRKYKKLQRFSRLPLTDRILTFEAAIFLAIARTWLLVVPFRKIAETLGTSHSAAASNNVLPPASEEQDRDRGENLGSRQTRREEYPRARGLHPAGDRGEDDAGTAWNSLRHAFRGCSGAAGIRERRCVRMPGFARRTWRLRASRSTTI